MIYNQGYETNYFGLAWPSILLPRLWFITWVMIYNQGYETNYYDTLYPLCSMHIKGQMTKNVQF